MDSLPDLIRKSMADAPAGHNGVVPDEPDEQWLPAPADPNAARVLAGEPVCCPRPEDRGLHETRIVPGTHMTDITLISLLLQAGWNIRLFGPAGYGKTSLAEAAMVAAQAALRGRPLADVLAFVSVFNGTTGVRDEAVVGRPVQTDAGLWAFAAAKVAVAIESGLGLVINEADLLGYTLKALNAPMERAPLSLDAYEPGQPDIAVHLFYRAIFTDNNDPQFPLEQSVRSRLKLELAVFDPDGLEATAVIANDVHRPSLSGKRDGHLYEPVAIPTVLQGPVELPANRLAVRLVRLLAKIGSLQGAAFPAELEGELNALGLDPEAVKGLAAGAELWVPGRREIIAITQAEQLLGTALALRAFMTKCSLAGMAQLSEELIERIWSESPQATSAPLAPLAL